MMTMRILLHILFWIAYLAWDTYIEFIWTISYLEKYSFWVKLSNDLQIESIILFPKVLLCYAFAFYLERIYKISTHQIILLTFALVGIGILCMLTHRFLSNYVAYPWVYREEFPESFWTSSTFSTTIAA